MTMHGLGETEAGGLCKQGLAAWWGSEDPPNNKATAAPFPPAPLQTQLIKGHTHKAGSEVPMWQRSATEQVRACVSETVSKVKQLECNAGVQGSGVQGLRVSGLRVSGLRVRESGLRESGCQGLGNQGSGCLSVRKPGLRAGGSGALAPSFKACRTAVLGCVLLAPLPPASWHPCCRDAGH